MVITIGIFLIAMAGAYLVGSVNFSILLLRLLGQPDPRTRFSRNAGATNVFRQAGWATAALVLMLDVGRSAAVGLIASSILPTQLVPWIGFGLILGNRFPCFHGFTGGKGVANYLGFHSILFPLGTLCGLLAFLGIFGLIRIPFLGSFALVSVLAGFGVHRWGDSLVGLSAVVVTAGAIVWFHRENIAALIKR